jgi:hypothetical protein
MSRFRVLPAIFVLPFAIADSQVDAQPVSELIGPHLTQRIVPEGAAQQQLHRYLESRIQTLPQITTVEEWTAYAADTRRQVLERVIWRGVPPAWREFPLTVREVARIPSDAGYSIRKLWIEIVPGLTVPALLYVPDTLNGQVPVFLNLTGHDPQGKATDTTQARCIHMARQGVICLNPEWFGMGQLNQPEFGHGRLNQLDLCGTSGVSLFYLLLSRSLDVLLSQEHADPQRVGVAGLSGGGWQTILISALDTRVTLCNPVAGYSGFRTRMDNLSDLGDSEQTPVDLGTCGDYTVLTALLAPRPALLTYNDQDDCCFATSHALPPLLDAARPIYQLLGQETKLRSHTNADPGTHNFLIDNRQALYRLIRDEWFGGDETRFATSESPLDSLILSREALDVPLPEPNLNFNALALRLAESLPVERVAMPTESAGRRRWLELEVQKVRDVIHLPEIPREFVFAEERAHTVVDEVEIISRRLHLGRDWSMPLLEFAKPGARDVILLMQDDGEPVPLDRIASDVDRGCRVYTFSPVFFGQLSVQERSYLWSLLVSTAGQRPLGIQADQLLAAAQWIQRTRGDQPVKLVTSGPRSSVIGLVAGAIEPHLFAELEQHRPLESLKSLLVENRPFDFAPELYCFGLLAVTDLPQLRKLRAAGLEEPDR